MLSSVIILFPYYFHTQSSVFIWQSTLVAVSNATQQIPGFDGNRNGNVFADLIMTNLGNPLTGSLAIGFTIGFMKG